jgi:hypothetical protein
MIAAELKTLPFATMDVGDAATAVSEPAALPETGASMWPVALMLFVSGVALMGIGVGLRQRQLAR